MIDLIWFIIGGILKLLCCWPTVSCTGHLSEKNICWLLGRQAPHTGHLLQRSLLCFPPDHITRSQMSVDESVGESSYQFLLQVLFYLILVVTNVRPANDPTVIIQLLITFLFYCFSFLTKGWHHHHIWRTQILFDDERSVPEYGTI